MELELIGTEEKNLLLDVEIHINKARIDKDLDEAMSYCRKQADNMRLSGVALAKALWMIREAWSVFEVGDDFLPTVQDYLGLHPHTIERYVKVWDMIVNYVPERLKNELIQKPIGSLVSVANAVAQGYSVEEKEWEKIIDSPDKSAISSFVRDEIKGVTPRSNSLTLRIDTNGSVWAYAQGNSWFVGSLEIKDDEEIVKKAVERIISNAGILRG